MDSVSATALSGLFANEQRIRNAAVNVANAQSENFRPQDIVQSTDATGGVTTRAVERTPATFPGVGADGNVAERPNVDVAQEIVEAQVASYNAQANLRVLQTQNRVNQFLLDIQA